MEQLYALGVMCIEFVQYWFQDYENFFEIVNHLSNPHYVLEFLFPLISVVDSVFAAQLLLCLAFGGWLNTLLKWWLLEERPYWWVRETTYYRGSDRPRLHHYAQTCETGPGSPSGHATTAATVLLLSLMWISHVMNDRKCYIWWWKYIAYPFTAFALCAVVLARMFVATHFPHQCLLGVLIGAFLAPALCIYVSDPFIWLSGNKSTHTISRVVGWHVIFALSTVVITVITYVILRACDVDPEWSVQMAFRWCHSKKHLHVSTSPLYAFVRCSANLLGWALCVTPALAKYRHYTKNRSLILSALATTFFLVVDQQAKDKITKDNVFYYYVFQFIINAIKPALLLRLAPVIAMWPYTRKIKIQ